MRKAFRKRSTLPVLPSLIESPPAVQLASGKAMRSEWRDPTDVMPSAARAVKTITGYRRYCPLRRCRWRHGESSNVSEKHILAADRLRALADAIAYGFTGKRDRWIYIQSNFGPVSGPNRAALKQARASYEFHRVMKLFDVEQRELLTAVVLLNMSVAAWCRERRSQERPMDERKTRQALMVCLDILAEHFASEIEEDLARGVAA